MFFVLLTIVKEGYDDFRRNRLDKVENACFTTVIGRQGDPYDAAKAQSNSILYRWNPFYVRSTSAPYPVPDEEFQGLQWVPRRWSNLKVGDVVRLCRDEPIPADVVLLWSSDENSLAYIDTMALDGETNLKSKQLSHALEGCGTIEGISKCPAEVVVEDPNPSFSSLTAAFPSAKRRYP